MYEHADQSWRTRPRVMSPEVIAAAAARVAEHARAWGIDSLAVVLHGGEPLLAGAAAIGTVTGAIREALGSTAAARFTVQTNGILLDEPMLEALLRHDVRVGVSVDGGRAAHDRHRRYAHGAGSHDDVVAGLDRLRGERYRHLYRGLLCTIDVRNDPVEVYEALLALGPPTMDLLLPHGNWTSPPPFRVPGDPATPYGDWLVAVFDRWYSAAPETDIRLFSSIITLLLGGASGYEATGLDPVDYVTIETDGAIEQSDALKTTADRAAATGLNVFDHTLDEALAHPGVRARQSGLASLAETCRRCPAVAVCGGGHYAHRFRAPADFANPTVYCADQRRLIDHIRDRVFADLRRALPAEVG
ncbi:MULTISPECIES: FxsB family cyclophane-forming radical SAM/SPASM peptide maturase [unclassified Actinoplanes]|uniref:FxsB family cyclophane-forming radical SAM/SPASM peptide maturase n=1 Tax=unclassified Actinoplanes TaxID=2626549 RepID=UPI0002E1146C|nr:MULTISPECIES: FxsB family cyclophane-forming radical SAM/SPASM peptide maturase [unclassified Actinoplanes]